MIAQTRAIVPRLISHVGQTAQQPAPVDDPARVLAQRRDAREQPEVGAEAVRALAPLLDAEQGHAGEHRPRNKPSDRAASVAGWSRSAGTYTSSSQAKPIRAATAGHMPEPLRIAQGRSRKRFRRHPPARPADRASG